VYPKTVVPEIPVADPAKVLSCWTMPVRMS
jgi:hypothetical protein